MVRVRIGNLDMRGQCHRSLSTVAARCLLLVAVAVAHGLLMVEQEDRVAVVVGTVRKLVVAVCQVKDMREVMREVRRVYRWREPVEAVRTVQALTAGQQEVLEAQGAPTAQMTMPTGLQAESGSDNGLAAEADQQVLKAQVAVLALALVEVKPPQRTRGQAAVAAVAPLQVRLAAQAGPAQ